MYKSYNANGIKVKARKLDSSTKDFTLLKNSLIGIIGDSQEIRSRFSTFGCCFEVDISSSYKVALEDETEFIIYFKPAEYGYSDYSIFYSSRDYPEFTEFIKNKFVIKFFEWVLKVDKLSYNNILKNKDKWRDSIKDYVSFKKNGVIGYRNKVFCRIFITDVTL